MNIILQLLGRLHPLVVHLPIGFIMLGLLFFWTDRKKKNLTRSISLSFLWGGISAVVACISGYLLYQSEGFAYATIQLHLYLGIITAIFCFLTYIQLKNFQFAKRFKSIPISIFAIALFVLISFTGHLGGGITHGEDYLVEPLPNSVKAVLGFEIFEEKTIELNNQNWEEAILYEELIHPILNNRCVSCHNSKKHKGDLVLGTPDGILNGGESGKVILQNQPEKSELYSRVILDKNHEDLMPPKGKQQLNNAERNIIYQWIEKGNSFDKSIKELGLKKELLLPFFTRKINNNYPDFLIEKANKSIVDKVIENGIYVDIISEASNFLSVSCINQSTFTDEDFSFLIPIANNIAMLDLGRTKVTDAIFKKLINLPNLTILKLDNTAITGDGIELLEKLENLKSINLTSSKFEGSNLKSFRNFKKLKTVYVHNTNIKSAEVKKLKLGEVKIEYGNYELPLIESDSITY